MGQFSFKVVISVSRVCVCAIAETQLHGGLGTTSERAYRLLSIMVNRGTVALDVGVSDM